MKVTKYDILAGTLIGTIVAGFSYGIYKIAKYNAAIEKEAEEQREAFRVYATEKLAEKDYNDLIRQASTFNSHLDAHQRNVAFDMLRSIMHNVNKDTTYKAFDADLENLNVCLDILLGDDETAILATIERELRLEESRKIQAQRNHELAMAKAAGENEIKVAKIQAEAETDKARLYSEGIKSAMSAIEFVKEAKNERSEKSED